MLREPIWETCPSTAEICITAALSNTLVTDKPIALEKISLYDMQNLGNAC